MLLLGFDGEKSNRSERSFGVVLDVVRLRVVVVAVGKVLELGIPDFVGDRSGAAGTKLRGLETRDRLVSRESRGSLKRVSEGFDRGMGFAA